jgi:hypothetical protein
VRGCQSDHRWEAGRIVQIASMLAARMRSGEEVGTKALSLLRLCNMGATPADAGKVSWAPAEDKDDLLD